MFVCKSRNLEIDAMVVKVFSEINKKVPQYSLSTHEIIYDKKDADGEYGYAEYVHGKTYHSNSRHLTGTLTPFFDKLINRIEEYSIEKNDIETQKEVLDYLLLDKVSREFRVSWDWHHENLIFNETSLRATPIDLEVVGITKPGPDMLYQHISNQIEEYVRKRSTDATDAQANSQTQRDLLLQKVNYLQKNVNEIYQSANLEGIKNEFFQTIFTRQPTIRYVPIATAEFYSLIYQYPPVYRFQIMEYSVRSKLETNRFEVNLEKWNQNFIKNQIFKNLSTINIPIFYKRDKIEDAKQIEEVICRNEVIATREGSVKQI